MSNDIHQDMVQPRGPGYRDSQIVAWSHYREPIDTSEGRPAGNSRRWGDASPEVQSRVIDQLVESSRDAGLDARETAYVLAIARVESGFNPDAAAGTTSASGVGQFINRTGASYGLNDDNRFDARAQSDALVAHFIDNRELARSRGLGEDHIYRFHHDGPTQDHGGLALSQREIAPYLDRYQAFAESRSAAVQGDATAPVSPPATTEEVSPARSAGSFQQAMAMVLPPQGGVAPHITGEYGENRGSRNHGGTDFNYVGGQTGLNREHPVVHSPVSGRVTFSGGDFGTVKIVDAQGNSHEFLHLDSRSVQRDQVISAGDPIGTMGGRGPEGASQYAQHVHYQLRDPEGQVISPQRFWDEGRGATLPGGTTQDGATTTRPAERTATQPLLRDESRGQDVRTLQDTLNSLGVHDARGRPLANDGIFGQRTGEAVRAFQAEHGLAVDGIVGNDTRQALERATQARRHDHAHPHAAPGQDATDRTRDTRSPVEVMLAAAGDRDPDAMRTALAALQSSEGGRAFEQARLAAATEQAQVHVQEQAARA